jgi:hypothetical protein
MTDFGFDEPDQPKSPATNRSAPPTDCRTCGGDRFVTVRLRSPDQTVWMDAHNLRTRPDQFHEEVAPCPDCGPAEILYRRYDGSLFRSMDPAAARQALTQ